jgi:uncharacterized Zn-binding protein involved in type VI secretion
MSKLITVDGRQLQQSNKSHPTLTYTVTETDLKAVKTLGQRKGVLLQQITLQCACSGDYVTGTSTFVGNGSAVIVAKTTRVLCEGKPIVLEGDKTTITCAGTITTTASGATSPGTASVTVAVVNSNQPNIFANEA